MKSQNKYNLGDKLSCLSEVEVNHQKVAVTTYGYVTGVILDNFADCPSYLYEVSANLPGSYYPKKVIGLISSTALDKSWSIVK